MSIQDDYFDLSAELTDENHKDKLERIWNAFCESEERRLSAERVCITFKDFLDAAKQWI